jgi:hypothetical protein
VTTHIYKGEVRTGNPYQQEGKHRYGVALIPLGDRQRAVFEYGDNVAEERESIDAYEKFLNK